MSPFLFALSLEPVASVRPSSGLHSVFNTSHSISLYDDILLYVEDAAQSVPHLLNLFNVFSSVSGYKVNWGKSALLPLYVRERTLSSLNIPVVKKIKYLGVDIYPSITDIIKNNYDRVARDTEADLQRWDFLPLSFAARISTIKMSILPRINKFISSMIPLLPIKGYWEKLHLSISKIIWGNKKHRVKLSVLQKPKSDVVVFQI